MSRDKKTRLVIRELSPLWRTSGTTEAATPRPDAADDRLETLESRIAYLQEEIEVEQGFGPIVGSSAAMRHVLKSIEMAAETDATILLHGEMGTGKELVARTIHARSRRRHTMLVKVDCALLPADVSAAELFGGEPGALGSVGVKKSRFELADRGTIFLDQVGHLTAEAQGRLLGVLQEQEAGADGSSRPRRVDVRVIAATTGALAEHVRRGVFEAGLFERLNSVSLRVPPLRERKEDLPALASHFVAEAARRMCRPARHVGAHVIERLMSYEWPGNIRELANVLERAVILCRGEVILEEHLGSAGGGPPAFEAFLTLEEIEKQHIRRALEQTRGVLAGPGGAARLLGMSRSTVWSRMRKLGINP